VQALAEEISGACLIKPGVQKVLSKIEKIVDKKGVEFVRVQL
jgi:hypothetical protein